MERLLSWISRRGPVTNRLRRLCRLAAVGLLVVLAAQLLPWRIGIVSGTSMTPTLRPGQLFLYQRVASGEELRPGEIVVVRHNGETWVKRIFATGGSRFWAWAESEGDDRSHYPIEPASRVRFARLARAERARWGGDARVIQLTVPLGRLFVVGDSLSSEDSRTFGPLEEDGVVGRVIPLPGQRLGTFSPWVELSFDLPGRFSPG